jgi:hypothetical protein
MARKLLYSRWPEPWLPEDDWGPITAAVLIILLLASLIIYGSIHHESLAATASPQKPLAKFVTPAVRMLIKGDDSNCFIPVAYRTELIWS